VILQVGLTDKGVEAAVGVYSD